MKNTDLAKKIKELRTKKGYSQEQLANLTDLSLRTIQRIENGETEPRGDTLTRLANVFEITPNDLMEWIEQEDHAFMGFLNLSALGFIIFPLLGIILPLALWILKKDKIRNIDEAGKKLINFQITWCMLVFAWYIFMVCSIIFHLPNFGLVSFLNMGGTELILLAVPGILYLYNAVMVVVNTIRSYRTGKVFYRPAIRFLK